MRRLAHIICRGCRLERSGFSLRFFFQVRPHNLFPLFFVVTIYFTTIVPAHLKARLLKAVVLIASVLLLLIRRTCPPLFPPPRLRVSARA